MLEIFKPQEDSITIKYAPDVYIDSVEYYGDFLKVYFHIEDSKLSKDIKWSQNDYFINNSYVYIICGEQIYKKSLKNLFKTELFKYVSYSDVAIFNFKDITDAEIIGYVGNDEVKGRSVVEKVLTSGSIENSYYKDAFKYYNKIKDFTLLSYTTSSSDINATETYKKENLFISYAPNKQINIATVVNLNKILLEKSKHYKFLSSDPVFKKNILSTWVFDEANSKAYIKNITNNTSEYVNSEAAIKVYRVSDDAPEGDYIVSCTISEKDLLSINSYDLKLSLFIYDHSEQFYKDYVHTAINKSIDFLQNYVNRYVSYGSKEDFFETQYKQYAVEIAETIETLSSLYSFKTSLNKEPYYSLFLSLLHPLTSDKNSINLLLDKAKELENYFYNKFGKYVTDREVNVDNKMSGIINYIKEYSGMNINGINVHDSINFDYDNGYGYDVISNDNYDIRNNEVYNGLKVISQEYKNLRYRLESIKYYGSYEETIANKFKHLSISAIDLGYDTYDLLNNFSTLPYNHLLMRINDYNNKNYGFRDAENYYFQLLDEGVYVKSIGEKRNDSYNNLVKTVLFDQNIDSAQNSLKYVSDTGINDIYLITDINKFIEISSSSVEQSSASVPGTSYKPYFVIDDSVRGNITQNKSRMIFYYNNFFEDKQIISGSNYSLYHIKGYDYVNQVIYKKLKLYNEYYLVETKQNVKYTELIKEPYTFLEELLINISPKYLNRKIQDQQAIITIEEL